MSNRSNKPVVVTTTFYPDSDEGRVRKPLALEFFDQCLRADLDVVNVDGGTDGGAFIDKLNGMGIYALPQIRPGFPNSRRQAITEALALASDRKSDYILWTEPEKIDIVRSIPQIMLASRVGGFDFMIPRRANMTSYPSDQAHSEQFGNALHTSKGYVGSEGQGLDTFFGVRAWRKEMTPYFLRFGTPEVTRGLASMRKERMKKMYGIESEVQENDLTIARKDLARMDHVIHMPVCLAILHGRKVGSDYVDFDYPKVQRNFEQGKPEYAAKRQDQLFALSEQFDLVKYLHEKEFGSALKQN